MPRLRPALEVAGVFQRVGDDAGGQAELDAVGDLQRLLIGLTRMVEGDGAEDLFIVDPHAGLGVGDQGRLTRTSPAFPSAAARRP
jgi:hypothetical protein